MSTKVLFLTAILSFLSATSFGAEPTPAELEAVHLRNIRRLTFAGSKNGEAYFSANGREIVFQGVREPGNPFYQIYRMDLAKGIASRVSTGTGKTTCSFFHPTKNRILFASTHLDGTSLELQKKEIEAQKSGPARRYSWDFDENFELFESDPDGSNLIRLTDSPGYDAECAYSPDGSKIVFCSMRDKDAEIYIMDSDGKNPKRLTAEKGYDGGPFFSPDGKKIVWRHFNDLEQKSAEIWTMNIDGSEKFQVTKLNAVTWAPYYHASMKWIVFASNFEDPAFEVYLIKPDGTDLTRLTYSQGFDGLPVFSPDGKKLMWTSNRFENKSHIVIADVVLPGIEAPQIISLDCEEATIQGGELIKYAEGLTVNGKAREFFKEAEMIERVRDLKEAGAQFHIDHSVAKQFHGAGLIPFGVTENIDDTFFIFGTRITGWLPRGKESETVVVSASQLKSDEGLPWGVAAQAESIKAEVAARKTLKSEKDGGIYYTASSVDDLDTICSSVQSDLKKEMAQRPLKIAAFVSALRLGNMRGHTLYIHGTGSGKGWREMAERLAAQFPAISFVVEDSSEKAPELKQFTDQKIPAIAFGGPELEAPMIGDDAAPPYDTNALACASAAYNSALRMLASGEVKIEFVAYDAAAAKAAADASKRPYLGTVPDYGAAGTAGVKLSGVREASPAQKAGLQAGDIVIELNGVAIKDVNEYLKALEGLKAGVETTIKFKRGDKEESMKITPGAR